MDRRQLTARAAGLVVVLLALGGVVVWAVGRRSAPDEPTPAGPLAPRLDVSIDPGPGGWLAAKDGRAEAHATGVAVSPDGKAVAVGSTDGAVRVWEVASGRLVHTLADDAGDQVQGVAYAPDGRSLAAGETGGVVRVWDPAAGRLLCSIPTDPGSRGVVRPGSLAFSPDGRRLAVSLWREGSGGQPMWGDVAVFDVASGRRVETLTEPKSYGGGAVAYAPDGTAVGWTGRGAVFADPDTGREVAAFAAGEGRSVGGPLAVSPDGRRVAARVSWDSRGPGYSSPDRQAVAVWDFATRKEVSTLAGHTAPVRSLAFLPGGETVVSASWDGTVRLWDAATGAERLVVPGRPGPEPSRVVLFDGMIPVEGAAVSADGSVLAAAYHDGVVRAWDVKTLLGAAK